ncbi:MAG: hypothetical protein QXF88_00530 [Candidatus Aenigmatarchaeota archaeon]
MKGATVTTLLTIVFIAFIIFTIILLLPSTNEIFIIKPCVDNFKTQIRDIVDASCMMDDTDLETLQTVDTSCFDKIEYYADNTEAYLKYKIKQRTTENKVDLFCPRGLVGYVEFDFSLSGDKESLQVNKPEYNFMIQPNKAKLVFCKGMPEICSNLNENDCKKQKGCRWSNSCSGIAEKCTNLNENECVNQKGCEFIE